MANSSFNLSDLNGSNGFAINGLDGNSGYSVSNAGDINNDGVDDLIISAPLANRNDIIFAGESYVVFGGANVGSSGVFNLSDLNGTNGFTITGFGGDSGRSVSNAGDINNDGIDDLIIGAPFAFRNGISQVGESYVVFGGTNVASSGALNLSDLNGANGFTITGINEIDTIGNSVSNAGDINNDGIDDLIIGGFGKSYVVFGRTNVGSGGSLNPSSLDGTNGFVINIVGNNKFSLSVSNAGDINNDGIDDLILGAYEADPNGKENAGQSYVIFGGKNIGSGGTFNLSNLNGTNGFAINGIAAGNESGFTVSNGGDINNDGIDDLIIGASRAPANGVNQAGQTYVLFGGTNIGTSGTFNLSDLNRTNGFVINGITENSFSSSSVSNAGDVNADGIDDLIIGAPNSNQTYVVFGGRNVGKSGSLNLSDLNGTNGFAIPGGGAIGLSVSSAGDINNDGVDDLIIGAPFASPNGISGAGQSYVLFGGPNIGVGTLKLTGTPGADTLVGTASNNIIDGLAGNDTLTGGGGQDKFVIRRGDGNDIITDFGGVGKSPNPSAAVIAKVDTLQFTGSGLTVRNLLLTQIGKILEVTFENVANTKVTLQNFQLENLHNLKASGTRPAISNILFDGQTSITNFNVFDANSTQTSLFEKNTVTFLNDLSNDIQGFDNSADVVNAQGGNDKIDGKSGNDLLRGGAGNDTFIGGAGNDTLVGGAGADRFLYNTNAAFASAAVGVDAIADFKHSEGDKIILDKTTFSAITSATGTGFSNASDFKITSSAATSTAKIVYDAVSGQLFYNQNGSAAGFGSGGLFATLTGAPTLIGSDFIIQA
ncbi:hemolysin-type calcium-binding region [Nostoc commune NIES-4072]|uniref:Hemolysin-type calcium-binding region n=1 Tax=Nostoc commune NIES-4072 TaxID=2005467 RepID=A0A2R5FH64_NOSCO|nr:FG-GAP repeat protein [Nostoc commune]BBD64698.1 hemolysin-type calcium-binding region [Nostoc commune HK-02]GBG17976.1 hemolysin-type calcium-binding region [Nostoc commune NIES-4072]